MSNWRLDDRYQLNILDTPLEMKGVEDLQRQVWSGDETEVVPAHMLLAAVHNGGLAIGAYDTGEGNQKKTASHDPAQMIGFVFGFPGLYFTADGPRPQHCSHMLAVHPAYRDRGIGFALKRAQWQMVRHQGIDRVTWTFDPLQSRNANLNITRLGAVCNTYLRDFYGEMRDELNAGMPSDRFQVDWWVNSQRVAHRLSNKPRPPLDLAHFLAAGTNILNPTELSEVGLPRPASKIDFISLESHTEGQENDSLILVEVPADFMGLKAADKTLALEWRTHTRALFEELFQRGYLVTDFVFMPGKYARSYYALTFGESTL